MKGRICRLCLPVLILAMLLGACTGNTEPQNTTEPKQSRALTAAQAFVYDCQSGSFSYLSGSPEDRVWPASITKLFTAYIALQYLEPDRIITAGDALQLVGEGSSLAHISEGDMLSVEMLVAAMLMLSGNDAAYLLAAEAGRVIAEEPALTSTEAVMVFVSEMNGQTRKLGMSGTRFCNPDGYHDDRHYTTFADMVTLAEKVMGNELIMKYASAGSIQAVFENRAETEWKNSNFLVDPQSEYYSPYALGLKTGQTPQAGNCLLSAFRIEDRQYIIGVFGCEQKDDRFADTLQLFEQMLEKSVG